MTDNSNYLPVDINQIAPDLNGKADVDLTNTSPAESFIRKVQNWVIPDYSAGVERETGTSFTVDEPCLLEVLSYFSVQGSQSFSVEINGKTWNLSTPGYSRARNTWHLTPGDTVLVTYTSTNHTVTVKTYPLKGGN